MLLSDDEILVDTLVIGVRLEYLLADIADAEVDDGLQF